MTTADGYAHKNVAIFGEFCAGKTTLAEALEDEYSFMRVSMAANLKNIVSEVYGTSDKAAMVDVMGPVVDGSQIVGAYQTSLRTVLQRFGQNAKLHDQLFWLRWFLRDTAFYEEFHLVMDDGRLPFEADELRKRGWLIVKIDTPLDVRLARHLALYGREPGEGAVGHETETQMNHIKYDLRLDGTVPSDVLADQIMRVYCA